MFCFALSFHLLLIELSKCLGIIRHVYIWNKYNTRVFHTLYLFGGEAILLWILLQMFCIGSVGIVSRCEFTCHCSAVSAKHNTIFAYNDWCLQRSTIVITCYVTSNILCIFVTLVISIINALSVFVYRESLCFSKFRCSVMRCTCSTTLGKNIMTTNTLSVRQDDFILCSVNLRGVVPLFLDRLSNVVRATLFLLGLLL